MLDLVHAVEPTDWQTTEGEVEHKTWEWDPPSFQQLSSSFILVAPEVDDSAEKTQIVLVEHTVVSVCTDVDESSLLFTGF